MRVLICGSRNWTDVIVIRELIDTLAKDTIVITGGALGADTIAEHCARQAELQIEIYRADWQRYGRAAGMIRNRLMLEIGKPDCVYAFQINGSRGTENMVTIARKAGVPVKVVRG